MNKKQKGAVLAATVASLFMAGQAMAGGGETTKTGSDSGTSTVKCKGVNACSGKSGCGMPGAHSCMGHNECKGKGWVKMSEKECKEKGGSVMKD